MAKNEITDEDFVKGLTGLIKAFQESGKKDVASFILEARGGKR